MYNEVNHMMNCQDQFHVFSEILDNAIIKVKLKYLVS